MQTELPLIHVISPILWIIKRLLNTYYVYLSVLCTKDALKPVYPAGAVWWIKVNIQFFLKKCTDIRSFSSSRSLHQMEWQCTWNCIAKRTRKFVKMLNLKVYFWDVSQDQGSQRRLWRKQTLKDKASLERYKKDRRDNNSSFTSLSFSISSFVSFNKYHYLLIPRNCARHWEFSIWQNRVFDNSPWSGDLEYWVKTWRE